MIVKATECLGIGVSDVINREPFCDWPYERESDEGQTSSITFTGRGIEMKCDQDEKITSIFVHDLGEAAKILDIPKSTTRNEVRDSFGEPSRRGEGHTDSILGAYGPFDRFDFPDYSVHFEYQADVDGIKLVTLMRPDVVPGNDAVAEESTEEDATVLVIIPSLVAKLLSAEQEKGTALSEAEVLKIRDDSDCVAMRPDDLPDVIERRGYEDIDPEDCWQQWQIARVELVEEG